MLNLQDNRYKHCKLNYTYKMLKISNRPYCPPEADPVPVLMEGSLCDSFRLPEVEEEDLDWDD